jgi:hypothetical protein
VLLAVGLQEREAILVRIDLVLVEDHIRIAGDQLIGSGQGKRIVVDPFDSPRRLFVPVEPVLEKMQTEAAKSIEANAQLLCHFTPPAIQGPRLHSSGDIRSGGLFRL